MVVLEREWKILRHINDNGPKSFTELVESDQIKLSRGTIGKYLKTLREKDYITVKNEGRKLLNEITTDGKLELNKKLGKKELKFMLEAYQLYEEKVKYYRDGFLERFGNLPNSFLLDCMEQFLELIYYKFTERLPSEDFHFYLAFYLARWDIQNSRSENWLKIQPKIIQLSRYEYCRKFKLEQTEIEYFCIKWSKNRNFWPIYDKDNNMWFLNSKSMLYEILMQQIYMRTRRGTLQELVFDNFTFNPSQETLYMVQEARSELKLKLDKAQLHQLTSFINKMISIFLIKKKGYKEIRLRLPGDHKSLNKIAIELETEVNQINDDSPRKLELFKALRDINAKLNNYKETAFWTEKYLELKPNDMNMETLLIADYLYLEDYDKFLEVAYRMSEQNQYDLMSRVNLIRYYVEINQDLNKAMDLIEEADRIVSEIPDLYPFFRGIEFYRAKIYFLGDNLEYAQKFAEKVWYSFEDHSDHIFSLIVDIYKKQGFWEILEDFCLDAYIENKHSPIRMELLFYAHLKRDSLIKAKHIYEWVENYYPEYLPQLEVIRKELGINN